MGRKKPPVPPSTVIDPASRATADRLGTIKNLAKKRKGSFNPVGDLDNAANRGTILEWMDSEKWIQDLKREGFTEFYAPRVPRGPRKGELPRGARPFGGDEFGKILEKTFPQGGPDLVAVDRKSGRILVGDITAGEWSTGNVRIAPGDMHRHPAVVRHEAEEVQHLVKTQRDAKRLQAALPEGHQHFEVSFQDRYYASERKASARFKVKRTTRGTGTESRMTTAAEVDTSRAVEAAKPVEREAASAAHTAEADVSRGLESAEQTIVPHVETHVPHPLPKARVISGVEHAAEGVRGLARGFKARSLVIGVKAWRAARTIGKVLVVCFVPLTALDFVFEIAMRIWDDEQEKDKRARREKQRAIEAVLKEGGTWIDETVRQAMRKPAPPTLNALTEANILNNVGVQERFLRDWNANPAFPGFLYARVGAFLVVETYRDMMGRDDEELTSYTVESREVHATNVMWEFVLEDIGDAREVEKTDDDTRRLLAAKGLNASALRKMVTRKRFGHTIVPPTLTPYDIVITKMNNLFVDIVQFTAAFTNAGQEVFTKPFSFDYRRDWQQFDVIPDFDTPPLNRASCEYCLGYLFGSAKRLTRHALEQQDLEGNLEDPRKGWHRRFLLLQSLLDGSEATYHKNFAYFADQVKHLVRRGEKDAEITAALDELYAGARSIMYDLERIERNLQKPEYYYYGPRYRVKD